MADSSAFLSALDRKAKWLAPAARATFASNHQLGSWLLDPLARWASAAYGEGVFDDAARGYAKYCLGVAKAQQVYERAGQYTPEAMPDVISEVYEDEGYMVPYMWAAILIYPFWPSMVNHLAMYRDDFLKALAPNAKVLEIAAGHGVMGLMAAEERVRHHRRGYRHQPSSGRGCQSHPESFRTYGPRHFQGQKCARDRAAEW